jgi:hypothetical protein
MFSPAWPLLSLRSGLFRLPVGDRGSTQWEALILIQRFCDIIAPCSGAGKDQVRDGPKAVAISARSERAHMVRFPDAVPEPLFPLSSSRCKPSATGTLFCRTPGDCRRGAAALEDAHPVGARQLSAMNDSMLSPKSLSIEPPRRDRITAISSAVQRRPIVLVVGMHRSGTSLCSHILSALGVDMADEIPGPGNASVTPDNPQGHWERWEIVEFHDRILGLFNRGYYGRFHDFALPVAWWADPRVAQIRREIVAFLEKQMGDGYFGFKDPRTVRLMPVWHQIFRELRLAPKVVLCFRNPAQVVRSLNARDGLDPEIGEYRWLVHMVDFFRYASNFDFCTVEYEEWFNNPSANIEKLQKFLDLSWQQSEADLGLVLSGLIDRGARHDDPEHRDANQPLVRSLYKLASRAGQDGEARDQIAYIVSQFVGFQQLQRPFQQAFEDVAKVADKFPEVEQEAAGLRAAVGERNAVVEAADAKAATVEVRLAERERALAEVSRRADELLAALQAAQAEAAVREAALAQAEREAQDRAVAGEAMQAEVGALREALAQAEREAQDRAVAGEALQAEIAAVQGALAAARQVEKAAIAAFRVETVAPTKPDRPLGWRQAVMRFFGAGTSF